MNEEQVSTNMLRLFGQFFIVPFAAFAYGFEMLLKTMQEMTTATNQGMGVILGPATQPSGPAESKPVPQITAAGPAL